nr:STY4528 family pathogenicity island replication protein [Pseudomonas sp. FFPRI_1]
MTMDHLNQHGAPVALNKLFDKALNRLQAQTTATASVAVKTQTDGFLFSGNRHDSVPRALLLDRRLTPLERNAWQVFRFLLNDDGITTFPTYDQLSPYLASTPCSDRASHETVAKALTALRLTRWISLVRRQRDPKSGRMLGNLYVLHDSPLTPYEAMQLDPEYLGLVSQALEHASKSVQRVGVHVLGEMADDPLLSGRVLPTRLQILFQQLERQGLTETASSPKTATAHDSEDGKNTLLRNSAALSSESEAGDNTSKTDRLRIPKEDRTVRIKDLKEIRTVLREQEKLRLCERFKALKTEQQNGALAALQSVEWALHQAILDEWDARCHTTSVRNPAGYLFGLIQKAVHGDFRTWAAQKAKPSWKEAPIEPAPISTPTDPKVAHAHIAQLRELMGLK